MAIPHHLIKNKIIIFLIALTISIFHSPHAISQRNENKILDPSWNCTDFKEVYSNDRWQYGKFRECVSVRKNNVTHAYEIVLKVEASDLEYFSGGIWHTNYEPWVLTVESNLYRNKNLVKEGNFKCSGSASFTSCIKVTSLKTTGYYGVSAKPTLRGMRWDVSPLEAPTMKKDVEQIGQTWVQSVNPIKLALTNNPDKPIVYLFDENHQIPIILPSGERTAYWSAGSMVILPKTQKLTSSLLGDYGVISSSRCEKNNNATVGDNHQNAEVYYPVQAWGRLNSPLVAFSVNYFDTRSQLNNKTWLDTLCSSVFGFYADNLRNGPYQGTPYNKNGYSYHPYFIDRDGKEQILDTMSFIDAGEDNSSSLGTQLNHDINASESISQFEKLDDGKTIFNFVAGVSLVPKNDDTFTSTGNIPTTNMTRRLALAYALNGDRTYIVSIGTGIDDGISRANLLGFMNGLGAARAIEFFDGLSANLVVRNDPGIVFSGAPKPLSQCINSGAWCYYNDSNNVLPSPAWMGIETLF